MYLSIETSIVYTRRQLSTSPDPLREWKVFENTWTLPVLQGIGEGTILIAPTQPTEFDWYFKESFCHLIHKNHRRIVSPENCGFSLIFVETQDGAIHHGLPMVGFVMSRMVLKFAHPYDVPSEFKYAPDHDIPIIKDNVIDKFSVIPPLMRML